MDFFSIDPFGPPANEVLERNLVALARTSPQAAASIRGASPGLGVVLSEASDGAVTGVLGDGRRLASARTPKTEATRLADTVDVTEAAGVCVVGFGIGHHLRVIAERMNKTGVVLCFEPDIGLLRAVFERVDHSGWMLRTNFVLLTDPDDGAAISRALSGLEGIIALGVRLVEHPASRVRLGESGVRFGQRFTDVLKAIRTTVVTTLVQSETTLTNLLMNLDRYAACAGINELRGCATGAPAVVVAAGPSLARNIDVLARAGVRERVVIIAVQTVLKTLLERGIRPHIVCALDHHEISRRFYEGLSASDVAGVTLVVEPKANPAILDAFPGAIRCLGEELLDAVVADSGAETGPRDRLKPGATVAHLCHYLARYMGCDPVVLVGQDLGFTDGQYYAAGAAIHEVWAGELGPFTTLEMREWERIAREKSLLRRRTDVLGREIYTDEQMATYLAQFESDFASDADAGLRVIDATEGGIAKQHTTTMTLSEAVERHRSTDPVRIPPAQSTDPRPEVLARLQSRVIQIRGDARRVNLHSRDTARLLRKMRRAGGDVGRINELVARIHRVRDEVTGLQPAFRLAQFLNQAGTLNRVRADRAIDLDNDAGPMDRQLQRAERDIRNVESIAESAQRLCSLLDEAAGVLAGGSKRTRDIVGERSDTGARLSRRRVACVMHVDFERGGLGTERSLEEPVSHGLSAVRLTVARLLAARRLREIICLTDDEPRLRRELGDLCERVRYAPLDVARLRARVGVIGAARRFASGSWRGGIAQLTCFDELFEPCSLLGAVEHYGLDAAVLVGPDWCVVDPSLIDSIVERYLEHPDAMRLTFTQAPPGLCGLLLDRAVCATLGKSKQSAGPFATVGALLGYVPFAPQADPIARAMCVGVPAGVRDVPLRCVADSAWTRSAIERALRGVDPIHAGAVELADAFWRDTPLATAPQHVVIELSTHSRGEGAWCGWRESARGEVERSFMPTESGLSLIESLRPGCAVTFDGLGDPIAHPGLGRLVQAARSAGVSTHLRTMLSPRDRADPLALGFDVISIDLLATSGPVYEHLAGTDGYDSVRERVESLLNERNERAGEAGLALPWIVPRITRCDETYEQVEAFYDGWLRACGCAVIDALPISTPGARIGALPIPLSVRQRDARTALGVLMDGRVVGHPGVNALDEGLSVAWQRVLHEREAPEQGSLPRAA